MTEKQTSSVLRPPFALESLRAAVSIVPPVVVGLLAIEAGWLWGWVFVIGSGLTLGVRAVSIVSTSLKLTADSLAVRSPFRNADIAWSEVASFEVDDPKRPRNVVVVFRPNAGRKHGESRLPRMGRGREIELASTLEGFRQSFGQPTSGVSERVAIS